MPIERLGCLSLAVALLMLLWGGSPLPLPEPADKAAHFAAFSLLTLLLWKATAMPLFALGAAIAFGALDEWRQVPLPGRHSDAADFLANLGGALAAAAVLFMEGRRACAESSPR